MSLRAWIRCGWLESHKPTRAELLAVFIVIDRDLEDARQNLSPDARFNIAFNAALHLCLVFLLAEGCKPAPDAAQQRSIGALPMILGRTWQEGADYLESCRVKRQGVEHIAGRVTVAEANKLTDFAEDLREAVAGWLDKRHPKLAPWRTPVPVSLRR